MKINILLPDIPVTPFGWVYEEDEEVIITNLVTILSLLTVEVSIADMHGRPSCCLSVQV